MTDDEFVHKCVELAFCIYALAVIKTLSKDTEILKTIKEADEK